MLITQIETMDPKDAEKAVTFEGLDCPVEFRRSAQAKRLSLKVSHTRRSAIVTLPESIAFADAGAFVARHLDWLRVQTAKLPQPVHFRHGAVIPFRGVLYRIEFVERQTASGVVTCDELDDQSWQGRWDPQADSRGLQHVPMTLLPRLQVSGGADHAPRRLQDWLKAEAHRNLSNCVTQHAANLGVRPKRVSVRDQATRWGSCSTNGTLSFSWRLIFAPFFVLDYVAAHEAAHLREMNHAPKFWRLVKETMPQMHKARTWLRTYGAELHRFTT